MNISEMIEKPQKIEKRAGAEFADADICYKFRTEDSFDEYKMVKDFSFTYDFDNDSPMIIIK